MNHSIPLGPGPDELGRAVAAVPGIAELYRKRAELRGVAVTKPTVTTRQAHEAAVAKLVAAGSPAELGPDVGLEVLAAQQEENRLVFVTSIRAGAIDQIETQIALVLAKHVDEGLAVLAESLAEVLDRARAAVAALDGARTPEAALRGGPRVVAAWQALDALAARYAEIRRAQVRIMRFGNSPQESIVRTLSEHGEIRGGRAAWWNGSGTPPWPHTESRPEDLLISPALLIWFVTSDVPVWLPTTRELAAEENRDHAARRGAVPDGVDTLRQTFETPDDSDAAAVAS